MKSARVLVGLVLVIAPQLATALDGATKAKAKENPLGQVIKLMDDLTAKLVKEGEAEEKAFHEYVEWCDDTSKNKGFEIKEAETKKGKLEAEIAAHSTSIEASTSKIDDLAGSISSDEKDLNDATAIRTKEVAEFVASEKELAETVDTLGRAISVIEREMAKSPGAFAQVDTSSVNSLLKVLNQVMEAASFKIADRQKLSALLQDRDSSDDDDFQPSGAPKAAAYKSHSSNILDVLEDMKEKAEEQLNTLRKEEVATKHNYDMLKQSLESQIGADKKALDEEKASKAEAQEGKATAEGDLTTTIKDLADGKEALATCHSNCMATAADHDVSLKSRQEELQVIAKAKKLLMESTGGASDQTYSMLQLVSFSVLRSRSDLAGVEVVTIVKKLAKEHHSAALSQLASRIAAIMQYGSGSGEDPFEKVKGLLQGMIEKLEKQAGEAADEKAYCDEQMSKTGEKQSELDDDVDKLKVKIDSASSASADLKQEVKELQAELAELAKSQAVLDKERSDSNAVYVEKKSDLEAGLTGVRKALGVLRDYYGSGSSSMLQDDSEQPAVPVSHSASSGAGGGIISILEVVESDFAKGLAEAETEESSAASEYEKMTQENKITKTLKEQDVKYKTQEFKSLDKNIAELSSDLKSSSAELDAVKQYFGQIKERCIAKPEKYSERVERRNAEIKGLREALEILENETSFTQNRKRGLRHHFLSGF